MSLAGSILCVAVMFLMNWPTALITFGCLFALYLVVSYRKPGIRFSRILHLELSSNVL